MDDNYQFKWYTLKCDDCGLVAPIKIPVNGYAKYVCTNCGNTTFDETFGNYGFEQVPAEIAENWTEPNLLTVDEIRKLDRLRTDLITSGELPGVYQPTRQMRFL